jgi:hypothetical protein
MKNIFTLAKGCRLLNVVLIINQSLIVDNVIGTRSKKPYIISAADCG